MPPFTIVVDTREQQPYSFDKYPVVRQKLDVGDYSILGLERRIAFERKNLDDYIQSVVKARERFFAEMQQLANYEMKGILVEATLEDILQKKYTSGANPNAVFGSTTSLIVDFNIPVYFLGNRQVSRHFLEDVLLRFHKRVSK